MIDLKPSMFAILALAACGQPQHAGGGGGGGGTGGGAGPVPAEVRKTVETSLGPNARIKAEKEHGVTIYEAKADTKIELEVADTGQIQKTEVALPIATLPIAVSTAAIAKGGTISEAEVVVMSTGAVFEVEVKSAAGEIEYTIDQTGKIVSEEKEAGEEDEKD